MSDTYAAAKDGKGLLRRSIEGALDGVKDAFGRDPAANAEAEESKRVQMWSKEMQLAEKFFEDWQEDGMTCVQAYLDEYDVSGSSAGRIYRLNLFHANVTTLTSIMYAKLPKVEADRRFSDPSDDVARVASEIITRLLSNDMNDPEDRLNSVLKQALQDRLVPGLGSARVRYCMTEMDDESIERPVDANDDYEHPQVKEDEWCDIEYVHWRDILWSPCRIPSELRWKAFRAYLTKAEVTARFGEEIARIVPFASRGPSLDNSVSTTTGSPDISQFQDRAQAEVWEIWDKASGKVLWFVKGCSKFLDEKDDLMELAGFFPDAPAMVANASTLKYMPKPDYFMARDLYEEINELELRIALLTKACKLVGVYPAAAKEIQRILTESVENQLIPVEAWAMFADKGGLKGQIDYLPIKEVAETLQILVVQQQQRIQQLYQVTGMSDIIRGQASTGGVTATEQKIKAQFASTRMQAFQDEFAEFASALLNRKVQLIRKYYDPERIKRLSNINSTPDAQLADQAIALIKDEQNFDCRVMVKAESMSQIDFEALKAERGEFMTTVAQFLTSAGPLLKEKPAAAPFLLELLKFNLAGLKGANSMEGVIDSAVAALIKEEQEKAAKPPEPTPEEKAAKLKTEGAIQIAQAKGQADAQSDMVAAQAKQAEAAADAQIAQAEFQMDRERLMLEMQQMKDEHALDMEKMRLEIQIKIAELGFKKEEHQMDLVAQQQDQALDAQAHSQDLEFQEEQNEQQAEQSDRQFSQQERHAEAAAKREASRPNEPRGE